ncbi:hypothetical protein [Runella sp. SP2]|nr:hypothetical protein [Runella sp. SP2]
MKIFSLKRAFLASTIALAIWVSLKKKKVKGGAWSNENPSDTNFFL